MTFKQPDDRRLKLTKRKFGIFYFQVKKKATYPMVY